MVPLTNTSRNIVRTLPIQPEKCRYQYGSRVVKTVAKPANQGPFASKYFIFIEAKQIDNAYVLLPEIAKRNRAGDSPSHFVSTFFTVKDP